MFWIQVLSYLLVIVINTGIALFILVKGVKKNYIKWASLTSIFTASLGIPLIFLMFRPTSGFWGKFTWIGIFGFPSYLIFVMEYINWGRVRTFIFGSISFLFAIAIFIITMTTDLNVPSVIHWYPERAAAEYGPLHVWARTYVILIPILGIILLLAAYRRENPLQKEKIKYFLFGLILFASSVSFFLGLLPLITKKLYIDFPLYFSSIWMVLTMYAVYKYKLFEISFVIARGMMTIFIAVTLISLHISAGWVFGKVLPNLLSNLTSTILVAAIFFYTPFRYKSQTFFDNLFLRGRYQYLELLKNSIKILNTFPNVNTLLEYVMQIVKTAFNPYKMAVLVKGTGDTYNVELSSGLPDHIVQQPVSDGLVTWLSTNRQTFIKDEWIERTSQWHASGLYKVLQNLEAHVCIPFIYKDEINGILSMSYKGNGKTYTVQDIDLLEVICTEVATIIENSRLSYEANVDSLTKLHHRRLFAPRLEQAVSETKENKTFTGVMMIDIDYFKKINDTYGHLCGDSALRYIAEILNRFKDTVYRYGGEEFAVIITDRLNNPEDKRLPQDILMEYAEDIRKSVESSPLECRHGNLGMTISVGATIFDGRNQDTVAEDLIKKADSALYLAKHQGRNRVVFMSM